MIAQLEQYKKELEQELTDILAYWMEYAVDHNNGGFIGKVDHDNQAYPEAPKGSVLNSRILWTFSAAYRLMRNPEYLRMAHRSFQYLADHFIDPEFGGVYWTVDHKGQPLDTKKQIYALSFAIYGLSEYYRTTKHEAALNTSIVLFQDIIKNSFDHKSGGYFEAFARDWQEISDLRLSVKDANEKKSMNTHLHLLEGFANLYQCWPDTQLRSQVNELVTIFTDHIFSADTGHLILFFDEEWSPRSAVVSYGHDIEASWLLQEAAERVSDPLLLLRVKNCSLLLARAAAKGLDADGGLWYEYDPEQHHLVKQKHSWPQAEAMIGFFNAWQNTGDETYLKRSLKSWDFVKKYMHDRNCGEWYWGVYEDYTPMHKEDKIGIWKCPYHNTRACIEIINRINSLID